MHSRLFIGKTIHSFATLSSTNSYAKELIAKDTNHNLNGSAIFAHQQTEGKGQQGNTWWSTPNESLTFSLILYPEFLLPTQQFLISKITCLALIRWLADIGIDAKIKWPNDIYVQNKKIAGILIENTIQQNAIKSSIVGIGININQDKFPELLPFANSVKRISTINFSIENCFNDILNHYDFIYLSLLQKKIAAIDLAYLNHLYGINTLLPFSYKGKIVQGTIKNVNVAGQLELFIQQRLHTFNHKEIEFIFNDKT